MFVVGISVLLQVLRFECQNFRVIEYFELSPMYGKCSKI